MATRLEINFKRLLNRCEVLAAERNEDDWRLEKYVGALQEQITELRKAAGRPSQESLTEYSRRLEFLKGILSTEKLVTSSERALQTELLIPALRNAEHSAPSRELHLQTKAKYQREMRDDLLGNNNKGKDGLRQRGAGGGPGGGPGGAEEDFDTVLKYHNTLHERLADEMVNLARDLKENVRAAGKIVQDDNKKLIKSTLQADSNMARLKTESERLEKHVAASCTWWIWIMLILVCVTFIWMVLFMKMFPKR